jgi:uncharacterized protein involved in high-affinity Fe2+ transport
MKKILTGTALVLTFAAGQALAQTQTATTPAAQPAAPAAPAAQPAAPAAQPAKAAMPAVDPAAEAKFKAADKNHSGMLEGAELDPYKAVMAKVDTNKDGKISHDEFIAAVKAGQIKL